MAAVATCSSDGDDEDMVFSDGEWNAAAAPVTGPQPRQGHREDRATARTGPQRRPQQGLPSAALVGTGSTLRRRFRFKQPEDVEVAAAG